MGVSTITRRSNGVDKEQRPTWAYTGTNQQLEMLESIRNTLEAIQRSQMLQCDVRHAIIDLAKTVRRIDRRLAKMEKSREVTITSTLPGVEV
jgi:hypothetical protein